MTSPKNNTNTSHQVFKWLFWITIITTLICGSMLLFMEVILPGIGILFGGAILSLVFAGFAGGLLPNGGPAARKQFSRSMKAILVASLIVEACGILLCIVHPGFLANLLAVWVGPQMTVGSAAILVILKTSHRK